MALVLADPSEDCTDAENGILFGVVFLDAQRAVVLSDGWRAVTDRPPTALGIFVDDLVSSLSGTLCDALVHHGRDTKTKSSFCDKVVRHDLAVPLAVALMEAVPGARIEGTVGRDGVALVLSSAGGLRNVLELRDDGIAWMREGIVARFMPANGPWGMSLHERAVRLADEILDRSGTRRSNVRTA